jgi:hypothetical protein
MTDDKSAQAITNHLTCLSRSEIFIDKMTKKTQPAPLGATYKQSVRLRWSRSKSDAAPNGAKRVLFDRCYKDFAPPELGGVTIDHRLLITDY